MSGKEALVFFYAVFWGATLPTFSRYRIFDGHRLREREERGFVARRLLIGFLLVNALPVVIFLVLYSFVISDEESALAVATGVVGALSIFSVVRILHAAIASKETFRFFYSYAEWAEIERSLTRGDNRSASHLLPGFFFLIAFPGLAYLLKTVT